MGLDPQADRDKVHEIVGVQLQESSFPAKLRVGEILDMYQSFYREPADVTELIDVLGLESKRKDYYRSLSGGQRQRLFGRWVSGGARYWAPPLGGVRAHRGAAPAARRPRAGAPCSR